jgi:uncharacterized iron-regulated membrane protein
LPLAGVIIVEITRTSDSDRDGGQPHHTWRRWVDRPEQVWLRQLFFQLHFWVGAAVGAWVLVMSVSGSVIVFRNQLFPTVSVEWLVHLHESLLSGPAGRKINGIGAFSLIGLCVTGAVIWWPGRAHWRRSLTISWRAHFPRIAWDAHSALGFWFLVFVTMWGLSGLYLSQPSLFEDLYRLDPTDRVVDSVLFVASVLHFGRFNMVTQIVWATIGLVPGILALTGTFVCCRRVIFHKPSNPRSATGQ